MNISPQQEEFVSKACALVMGGGILMLTIWMVIGSEETIIKRAFLLFSGIVVSICAYIGGRIFWLAYLALFAAAIGISAIKFLLS